MPGQIITISGVDGSGKSSVIELLQQHLENRNVKSRYVWLRYNHYLTKFLLAFCRFAGFTKYEYFENSRVVYHNFYKSSIVSWLFVLLTFIDTLMISFFLVYIPRLFLNKTIICDRWIFDIMVDLEVDTRINFSKDKFISKIFKLLIPNDCQYFVLFRDIDKVRSTRDESMNDANFPIRCKLYSTHSTDPLINCLDNNGTLEDTVDQIIKII